MPYIAIIHVTMDHTNAEDMLAAPLPAGARWVGLFEFPDRKELKCEGSCTRKGMSSWGRNPKGFMRCTVCGSRSKRLRQWLIGHLFDALGANLYEKAPAAFRTPKGYGNTSRGQ